MLLAYFDKKNSSDEAELLNAFQTRLQISDTGERVSTEIQDLLNNLSTLKLNKEAWNHLIYVFFEIDNILYLYYKLILSYENIDFFIRLVNYRLIS